MATISRAVGVARYRFRLKDGTGSPNSLELYLTEPPVFGLSRPRDKQVLMGQYGGTNTLLAIVDNGPSGPSTLTISIPDVDLGNDSSADVTMQGWLYQLFIGAYSGAFAAYVDTNSLPLGGSGPSGASIAALGEIIIENSGPSSFDSVLAADMCCTGIGDRAEKNGASVRQYTFLVLEEWTRTNA